MSRIPLSNRRVWITGASSGIGRACALEFARRGAHVAVSARNTEALEDLAREIGTDSVLVVPLDVRDRQANHDAVAKIVAAWGGVDTVVLNAGVVEYIDEGVFDAAMFDRVFATNLHGFVYGMEASLPALKEGKAPHLVGMSSASVYLPLPRGEAYATSKIAVRYLLDSFRYRSEACGLEVSSIHPGFVKTQMTDHNDFPMMFLVTPEEAARRIADGIESRRREIHFPKPVTWAMKLVALLPNWLYQATFPRLVKVPSVFEPKERTRAGGT